MTSIPQRKEGKERICRELLVVQSSKSLDHDLQMCRVFNIVKHNNKTGYFYERRLSVVYLRECLPFL